MKLTKKLQKNIFILTGMKITNLDWFINFQIRTGNFKTKNQVIKFIKGVK